VVCKAQARVEEPGQRGADIAQSQVTISEVPFYRLRWTII
jgi:hypothetical protein